MKTIYKYQIPMSGIVVLPAEYKILKFGIQQETICLWALVDSETERIAKEFVVVGTGWNLDDKLDDRWQHMETLFENGFVWHVFMKENR